MQQVKYDFILTCCFRLHHLKIIDKGECKLYVKYDNFEGRNLQQKREWYMIEKN